MVLDKVFKERLSYEMQDWVKVKERGLAILPWWEVVVIPGIRRLAIDRGKEQKKCKRSRLNCLLLKQIYFTKELEMLGKLKEVKAEICEWFDLESRTIIFQSWVEDIQQSEKSVYFIMSNTRSK